MNACVCTAPRECRQGARGVIVWRVGLSSYSRLPAAGAAIDLISLIFPFTSASAQAFNLHILFDECAVIGNRGG